MRWTAGLGIVGLVAATAASAGSPAHPKLVVAIAVDQFSAELFDRYRGTFTGGLRRLGDGISFTGYQSHAATETCPGHSTILTGRHPAATGIVANSWFDVKTGSSVYCVSVRGTADPHARGPQNLRVPTMGEWLKQAEPGARVVSVSGKDRAAIMLAGHRPDAVYWWEDGTGFATSSHAGPATPAVTAPAAAFNRATLTAWRTRPPALWPAAVPPACRAMARAETFGGVRLSGHVPPDAAAEAERGAGFAGRAEFQEQLRASPLFDQLVVDYAGQLIDRDRLGRGAATDLLAISLSATDYVGHRYGNGGPEMCAQMAALDRVLGAFLQRLDATGVPYVVALTADHGGTDAAEREAARGTPAMRIDPTAFVKGLNDHLRAALKLDYDPVVGDDPQQLVVNVPDPALHDRVVAAAVPWLKARPEVADVFTAAEVIAAAPPPGKPADRLTVAERFHESYDRDRSGDIAVAFRERSSIGMPRTAGDVVAGHGSPWDHDRRVPILFWWPGVTPDRRAEPIETVDIAPTLSAIAGVTPPALDGRCLPQVAGTCPAGR